MMKPFARGDLDSPALVEWLGLDREAFKKRFSGTPMQRTKRRGILRNVCIALGNTGSPMVLPFLEKATSDEEPLIAEHALWAIAEIEKRHPQGEIMKA